MLYFFGDKLPCLNNYHQYVDGNGLQTSVCNAECSVQKWRRESLQTEVLAQSPLIMFEIKQPVLATIHLFALTAVQT